MSPYQYALLADYEAYLSMLEKHNEWYRDVSRNPCSVCEYSDVPCKSCVIKSKVLESRKQAVLMNQLLPGVHVPAEWFGAPTRLMCALVVVDINPADQLKSKNKEFRLATIRRLSGKPLWGTTGGRDD